MSDTKKNLAEASRLIRRGGADLAKAVGDPFDDYADTAAKRDGFRRLPGPEPRRPKKYGQED